MKALQPVKLVGFEVFIAELRAELDPLASGDALPWRVSRLWNPAVVAGKVEGGNT
jgi:hypothetical protein